MPYLSTTANQSGSQSSLESSSSSNTYYDCFDFDDIMCTATLTRTITSASANASYGYVQTNTSPAETPRSTTGRTSPSSYFIPSPNVDFLSKYQVTLPTATTELSLTKADAVATSKSTSCTSTCLPECLKPSDFDVVCGRGKGSYNRPGNKRFRAIVRQHMDEYQSAQTKLDKTLVLNRIMERVRAQNQGTTRFVKKIQGKDKDKDKSGLLLFTFTTLSDDAAREKVGHAIREAIISAENIISGSQLCREEQHEWIQKQSSLLSQQQSIFQNLVAD
jgi:hypothetical protein